MGGALFRHGFLRHADPGAVYANPFLPVGRTGFLEPGQTAFFVGDVDLAEDAANARGLFQALLHIDVKNGDFSAFRRQRFGGSQPEA